MRGHLIEHKSDCCEVNCAKTFSHAGLGSKVKGSVMVLHLNPTLL